MTSSDETPKVIQSLQALHYERDGVCITCSDEIGYTGDGDGGEYYESQRSGVDWPCETSRLLLKVSVTLAAVKDLIKDKQDYDIVGVARIRKAMRDDS